MYIILYIYILLFIIILITIIIIYIYNAMSKTVPSSPSSCSFNWVKEVKRGIRKIDVEDSTGQLLSNFFFCIYAWNHRSSEIVEGHQNMTRASFRDIVGVFQYLLLFRSYTCTHTHTNTHTQAYLQHLFVLATLHDCARNGDKKVNGGGSSGCKCHKRPQHVEQELQMVGRGQGGHCRKKGRSYLQKNSLKHVNTC